MDAITSPDGALLVTGGRDGKLRFWDVASGQMMWTLDAHRTQVGSLRFEGADLISRGFAGDLAR